MFVQVCIAIECIKLCDLAMNLQIVKSPSPTVSLNFLFPATVKYQDGVGVYSE